MSTPAASSSKPRPEFRNIHVTQLFGYRLPLPGIVSIMHRISGALLFLALPALLWLFELSLRSELSYAKLSTVASNWLIKLILIVLAWAFFHHLVAGLRYLLLDLDIGVDKQPARTSAALVYFISVPLTVLAALAVFGVI
jgi:succinate dehydrogenase / fumarate reductase cytochrome b subunit